MASQNVAAIEILDRLNPIELQTWFTNHPSANITSIVVRDNVFYIVFT